MLTQHWEMHLRFAWYWRGECWACHAAFSCCVHQSSLSLTPVKFMSWICVFCPLCFSKGQGSPAAGTGGINLQPCLGTFCGRWNCQKTLPSLNDEPFKIIFAHYNIPELFIFIYLSNFLLFLWSCVHFTAARVSLSWFLPAQSVSCALVWTQL